MANGDTVFGNVREAQICQWAAERVVLSGRDTTMAQTAQQLCDGPIRRQPKSNTFVPLLGWILSCPLTVILDLISLYRDSHSRAYHSCGRAAVQCHKSK